MLSEVSWSGRCHDHLSCSYLVEFVKFVTILTSSVSCEILKLKKIWLKFFSNFIVSNDLFQFYSNKNLYFLSNTKSIKSLKSVLDIGMSSIKASNSLLFVGLNIIRCDMLLLIGKGTSLKYWVVIIKEQYLCRAEDRVDRLKFVNHTSSYIYEPSNLCFLQP